MYQLWTCDEYGGNSIIASSNDVNALIKRAKTEVNNLNMENALTAAEKLRNCEAIFVELVDPSSGELIDDAVYAGRDNTGHPAVTPLDEGSKLLKLANCNVSVRAYLGELNDKAIYAADERGKELNEITSPELQGKLVYYIRRI